MHSHLYGFLIPGLTDPCISIQNLFACKLHFQLLYQQAEQFLTPLCAFPKTKPNLFTFVFLFTASAHAGLTQGCLKFLQNNFLFFSWKMSCTKQEKGLKYFSITFGSLSLIAVWNSRWSSGAKAFALGKTLSKGSAAFVTHFWSCRQFEGAWQCFFSRV